MRPSASTVQRLIAYRSPWSTLATTFASKHSKNKSGSPLKQENSMSQGLDIGALKALGPGPIINFIGIASFMSFSRGSREFEVTEERCGWDCSCEIIAKAFLPFAQAGMLSSRRTYRVSFNITSQSES